MSSSPSVLHQNSASGEDLQGFCTVSGKNVPGVLSPGEGHALQKEDFKILCEELFLLTWSIPDLDRHFSFLDLDLTNCSSHFWVHAESLAPNPHRCRTNHQEGLLFVTEELNHSEQYTHKLSHRPGICASWKMGDTRDRICFVNPRKTWTRTTGLPASTEYSNY